MNNSGQSKPCVGFLTVVNHAQYGLFGGYLILNTAGRPMEFHCTAPVKPNRAQEILYGPTLEAFLYGEQIGQTLIAQASHQPLLVCTDKQPALAARDFVTMPLVVVLQETADASCDERVGHIDESTGEEPEEATASSGRLFRLDVAHRNGPKLATFTYGRNRLAVPDGSEDRQLAVERLGVLGESFDLAEPFQRIRAAIEEAQQAVR